MSIPYVSRGKRGPLSAAVLAVLVVLLVGLPLSGAWARGKAKVTWYGQSAFKIVTPSGGVILIDPWLNNPKDPDKNAVAKLGRVDYILLSHGHFDHVGQTVEIARKTGAKLVTSSGLGANMVAVAGFPKDQAGFDTIGNVGGVIDLPKAKARVTIVNAVHGSELHVAHPASGGPAVVTGGNPIGFVLQMDDGPTFYHTGDTDVFGDMKLIGDFFKVDVMLACIGDHFTMGPHRAAYAAKLVHPREIVPMHFGTFPVLVGTPAELRSEIAKLRLNTKVVEMHPGETREF